MAEDFESRTEAPTPRRREEARQQGRVAVSPELVGGLILLGGVVLLSMQARSLGGGLLEATRTDLRRLPQGEFGVREAAQLLAGQYQRWLGLIGSFLVCLVVASVGVNLLQVGFHLTPERMEPDFGRLSPANGLQRLFSMAAVVRGFFALIKVAALAVLAYVVLRGRASLLASLSRGDVGYAAAQGWALMMRLCLAVAGVLFLLGIVDFIYQKVRFERSLRMTRQEVKEELKREEGDLLIRSRIRQIQRDLARRRMMAAVPRATVVVTNPTHLAVALRYERGVMPAPRVVAKGAGYIAQNIVETARRHGVPVIERRPLAQALYKAVKLDREIPLSLFQAVAEILAHIYRLRGMV